MGSDSHSISISSAQDLHMIKDEGFSDTFTSNLNTIFAHPNEDISKLITHKNKKILGSIWNNLISRVQAKMESCTSRTPLPCKKNIPDISSEICILGRFLTTPETTREPLNLDSFFSKPIVPEVIDLSVPGNLISYVTQLRSDFDSLKQEVLDVKNYNKLLKTENTDLKTKLHSYESKLNKDEPEMITSDSPTDLDNPDTSECVIIESNSQFPVQAATSHTYAFIGNIHPRCTMDTVRDYMVNKINANIDIEQLNTVSNSNAFKISVPKDKLKQSISGWPKYVKAEPYVLHKPKVFAAHASNGNPGFKNRNKHQRFRIPHQNTSRQNSHTGPRTNYRDAPYQQKPHSRPKNPFWVAPSHSNWTDQYSFRPNGHC